VLSRFFVKESVSGRVLCLLAALNLFLMMMLTAVDVIGRYVFNMPVKGGYELIEIMMGVSVFTILPVLSATNDQISVDLLNKHFKAGWERPKNVLVALSSAVFLILMGWRLWHEVARNIEYADASPYLRLPLAPLTFAFALLTTIAAVAALACLADVATGARQVETKGEESL
jgi:TRAP-type C4-dicarboxylate transport system permease small subunit